MKTTETLKEEMNRSLKEIGEVQTGEGKNKMVQYLKLELETVKKTQTKEILEMKYLGKKTGATDASITNRIQEMEERVSGIEDMIEEINTSIKENVKSEKLLT